MKTQKYDTQLITNKKLNQLIEEYKAKDYDIDSETVGQVNVFNEHDIILYAFRLDKNWIIRRRI